MIIVTGGAGFIGSHIVERLVRDGYSVGVIDNLHTGSVKNTEEFLGKVKFVKKDAGSGIEEFYGEDVEAVMHLGIASSSPMYRENRALCGRMIEEACKILDFAAEKGCKVIIAGTSSVYNGNPTPWKEDMEIKPLDFYSETRYAIERIAKVYSELYGVSVVVLRLFSAYGEREEYKGRYANMLTQILISAIKGEEVVIYGDGTQSRDFVYVKDVVEAFMKALEYSKRDYDVFNVGFGRNHSFNEII
jgi:UDP-glucose 4-epimerase